MITWSKYRLQLATTMVVNAARVFWVSITNFFIFLFFDFEYCWLINTLPITQENVEVCKDVA